MNQMILDQTLACPPGSLPGGLTRTRFFDGMFLTQADLENEQVFWRMKRRLTNRALGTGVVWGLKLGFDVKTQKYRLSPGYALDCCGNDLVVECPVEITQAELFQRSQPLLAPAAQPANSLSTHQPATAIGIARLACVVLQYVECPDGIRPVHRDACSPIGSACEPSRIRESCRLLLVPECEQVLGCQPLVQFQREIATLRTALGAAASPPAAESWIPSATYGDAKQTIGSLVLAALSGYLATAEKYHASAESQLVVSYLISSVLSGLLDLEVDGMTDANRATLSTAVNALAAALCEGLLYPGPRCLEDHHGVFLGCVRLSRTNTVETFTPWVCRREVLTGPLLNWWLCQFGVRPLDILINSIASSQCDVASVPQTDPNGNPVGTILRARGLTDAVDGQVTDRRTVAPLDFVGVIARALTGTNDAAGLVKVETTAPNGQPMSMVVPAAAVATGGSVDAVAALASAQLTANRDVQPLSRGPLRDLISELAARTPVSGVAASVDADAIKTIGTMTVSELLATEPEALLAKLGGTKPTDAQRLAVNQLYTSAEGFVRDATAAASAAAKAGVTRAQLKAAELKAALKKVSGTTAGAIDAAALAATKR